MDGNSAGRYQQIWEEEQTAELRRFHGDPVVADELPRANDYAESVQRPTTTFPAGWIDIRIRVKNDLTGQFYTVAAHRSPLHPPTKQS